MAKKEVAVTHTLPKTLYAYEEHDDGTFLIAGYTLDDLADAQKRVVGVYQLVQAGHLQNVPNFETI